MNVIQIYFPFLSTKCNFLNRSSLAFLTIWNSKQFYKEDYKQKGSGELFFGA